MRLKLREKLLVVKFWATADVRGVPLAGDAVDVAGMQVNAPSCPLVICVVYYKRCGISTKRRGFTLPQPNLIAGSSLLARSAPAPKFEIIARSDGCLRKLIEFDGERWQALELLARDRMSSIQELADEAFRDLPGNRRIK